MRKNWLILVTGGLEFLHTLGFKLAVCVVLMGRHSHHPLAFTPPSLHAKALFMGYAIIFSTCMVTRLDGVECRLVHVW
jgi:hypothetical protein